MKLITRQSKANEAADQWQLHYSPDRWPDKQKIAEKLRSLGDTPNPDDVDRIIGNGSWTKPGKCDECGKDSGSVIQLGEEPDHESHTTWLCELCMREAIPLFKKRDSAHCATFDRIAYLTDRSASETTKAFDALLRDHLRRHGPEHVVACGGTGFMLCYSPVDDPVYVGGDIQPSGSVV